MFTLCLHPDAQVDLESLWQSQPEVAAYIEALLEQIKADQSLMDRLLEHHFGADRDELFHVSKWQALWRKGYDLWRIKAWNLERQGYRFRIVYAFETRKSRHHVLAIAPREFDYDPNHPLSRRILAAYSSLGLARY